MKKLLSIVFISTLLFSCSQDNGITDVQDEQTAQVDLEKLVAQGKYDNSQYGIYEGVFSSIDGNRATVRIAIQEKGNPEVTFNFPDGSKTQLKSSGLTKASGNTNTSNFSGKDFSLDFTVNSDGTEPLISNVTYMGKKGDVLIMKETSKNAITPRTGTYSCISGCDTHPDLGKGKTQTFNAIIQTSTSSGLTSSGDTESTVADNSKNDIVFQVQLASEVFYMYSGTPTMPQNNCQDRTRDVFIPGVGTVTYNTTRCDFTGYIQGGSGLATVNGTHRFGRTTQYNGTTTDFNCSDFFGTFTYTSEWFGTSNMTFQSDDDPGNDYCFLSNP
ncbi:hypothetical protein C7S20_12230 [Christiangramia fulva]|uniref:Lipoprotein n=1 Tax=Christiangramia fulva TaxID=2126553 RepID=A0A2R3Z6R8_9FLAO|nr:hypothetical protein [Christiangramia fulva]AVR45960.1 hypothetical protein C7S20_12230 [Christiangramia fulva]